MPVVPVILENEILLFAGIPCPTKVTVSPVP